MENRTPRAMNAGTAASIAATNNRGVVTAREMSKRMTACKDSRNVFNTFPLDAVGQADERDLRETGREREHDRSQSIPRRTSGA